MNALESKLKSLYESFNKRHEFKPGDIVEWKPGLENKGAGGPFVVMEVLAEPVFDSEDSSGSPYFMEPLGIILGAIGRGDNLVCRHHDSRRFQPVE